MILARPGEPGARWQALAALNIAAVIFGSVALFGKIDASPAWIVAGRTLVAAAVLLSLNLALKIPLRLTARQSAALAATAALLALHWVAFFASVQMAGVAVGALTVSTFPLFTVLIEAAMARRAPARIELVGGVMIIAATALIAGPARPDAPLALAGALAGLAAAALFAVFALASRRLIHDLPPTCVTFYQNAMVALMLLPFLPFLKSLDSGADWLAIVLLGVIGTALSHQLYLFALKRLPAAACGAVAALEPVYAVLFAALLFAEPVRPAIAAGAALIVGASWLMLRRQPDAERAQNL